MGGIGGDVKTVMGHFFPLSQIAASGTMLQVKLGGSLFWRSLHFFGKNQSGRREECEHVSVFPFSRCKELDAEHIAEEKRREKTRRKMEMRKGDVQMIRPTASKGNYLRGRKRPKIAALGSCLQKCP